MKFLILKSVKMKHLLYITFLFSIACHKIENPDKIHKYIIDKFPNDKFIEDSFDKIKRDFQEELYDKEIYFPLTNLNIIPLEDEDELEEETFIKLHHIYDIQRADKIIHDYMRQKKK